MSQDIKLDRWLQEKIGPGFRRVPLAGDASARRYYRVYQAQKSYIVMDAAAAPPEEFALFIRQALFLKQGGICVPEIMTENRRDGFLLLSDFGDTLYLDILNETSADDLYQEAFEILICLQKLKALVSPFDRVVQQNQLIGLFEGWYLKQHPSAHRAAVLEPYFRSLYQILFENARAQPYVLIHRDYHSRNLMRLEEGKTGVLDFQDAMLGPVTYDLVSLLQDCYIEWPRARVEQWVFDFQRQAFEAGILKQLGSAEEFLRWFDLTGLQRHLKNLGVFTRLFYRDAKEQYLQHIPRVLGYILQILERHADLARFRDLFEDLEGALEINTQ